MEKTPKFIAVDTGKFATKAVTLRGDGSERFITFRIRERHTPGGIAAGKKNRVLYLRCSTRCRRNRQLG